MAIHSKLIDRGHILCWSDLPKSQHQTLILEAHGAEVPRIGLESFESVLLQDLDRFGSTGMKIKNITFTKRADLELSFISPSGYNTRLYAERAREITRDFPIEKVEPPRPGASLSEKNRWMEEVDRYLEELKHRDQMLDNLYVDMLARLLTNSVELSETIPYGSPKTVQNYYLGDVQGLTSIKIAMDAMRKEEEETYKVSLTRPYSQTLKKQANPFLYDDMPSILVITQRTDLETILNIPELKIYKRVVCTFCRGPMFGSGKPYEATRKKHGK